MQCRSGRSLVLTRRCRNCPVLVLMTLSALFTIFCYSPQTPRGDDVRVGESRAEGRNSGQETKGGSIASVFVETGERVRARRVQFCAVLFYAGRSV